MGIDNVVGILEKLTIALFVFLQSLLCFSVLGNICGYPNHSNYVIRIIGERRVSRFERYVPNVYGCRKHLARKRSAHVLKHPWIITVYLEDGSSNHFLWFPP